MRSAPRASFTRGPSAARSRVTTGAVLRSGEEGALDLLAVLDEELLGDLAGPLTVTFVAEDHALVADVSAIEAALNHEGVSARRAPCPLLVGVFDGASHHVDVSWTSRR